MAFRALSMPARVCSIQASTSEGGRSYCREASLTVVWPWVIANTSANFRRAVQRRFSSSIPMLMFESGETGTP
jgi:uncharacterized protein CbrC (UPF0167 family)